MKKQLFLWLLVTLLLGWQEHAMAHFAMIIPSDSMIMEGEKREVTVTLSFSHPFQREGMDIGETLSVWRGHVALEKESPIFARKDESDGPYRMDG